MSTTVTRIVFLAILLFASAGIEVRAQFDFTALQGLPTAQSEAQTSLGTDAYPVLIGAPGNFEYQGFPLKFDLESGSSSVWGYVFYSPSKEEFASFIVIRVIAYQAIAIGSLPFPIPVEIAGRLTTTGPHADSDKMLLRLENDTAYQRYRSDLPDAHPTFVSLSQLVNTDSLELPNGFPVGQSTWTMMFQGGGDSTMTCFVASETGEAFCRRIYNLPTMSVDDSSEEKTTGSALSVVPNPASGQVVVEITAKEGKGLAESTLLLYNEVGEVVLDLTEPFRENGYTGATFPASLLPNGLYHCTLVGPSIKEHVGIIVVE